MASGKIVNLWGNITAFDFNPPEGMLVVFVSRKRRVYMLDAGRPVVDVVVEYDEGMEWFESVGVPLTLLGHPHLLQTFIESSLAGLNAEPNSLQGISRGIASFIDDVVGGYVKEFYVGVDLEIIEAEVVQHEPVHLRLLLQEYQARLRGAAVPMTLEEPRGASRESVQRLRATSFIASEAATLGPCTICLEDLAESEGQKRSIITMPCDHLFHDSCILTWLERNRGCPLCRREVSC